MSSAKLTLTDDEIQARVKVLRARAVVTKLARRLFIPAVAVYSMFLLRPREGQFIRHIAECRYFDAKYNAQFPALTPKSSASSVAARHQNDDTQLHSKRWLTHFFRGDAKTAQPSPSTTLQADTERELRRKLMFKRDESIDGPVVTNHAHDEHDRNAQHTMAAIAAQLEEMSVAQREVRVSAGVAIDELPHHPVSIYFEQRLLYSVGEVRFESLNKTRRYAGLWGSLWWEL